MLTPEHGSMSTREHGVYLIMGQTLGLFNNREDMSPRLSYDQIKWVDEVCAHLYGP